MNKSLLTFMLSLSLLIVAQTVVSAQSDEKDYTILITFPLIKEYPRANQYYLRGLKNRFHKSFHSSFKTVYKVIPGAEIMKENVIEGMETYSYIDVNFKLTVKNVQTEAKTTFYKPIQGKGDNMEKAMLNAVNKFVKNEKIMASMIDSVRTAIEKDVFQSCDSSIDMISTDLNDLKEINNLLIAISYHTEKSPCHAKATAKMDELISRIDQVKCDQTIRELTIAIESGVYNPSSIVRKLQNISPNAPCAAEALVLAKKVGEQQKENLKSGTAKQLESCVIILQENNYQSWRGNYLHRIRK